MKDPIHEVFSRPIPPEVWHYTTIEGFEGIVSSGKIWATEARCTTDKTEFIHARTIADALLSRQKIVSEASERIWKHSTEHIRELFEEGALAPEETEVFLVSFTDAPDLKSQWIDYAGKGTGVAIAFDLRQARPPEELQYAVTSAPCVYEAGGKEKLIAQAVGRYIEPAERLLRETGDLLWIADQLRTWGIVDRVWERRFNREEYDDCMYRLFESKLDKAFIESSFDLLRVASHCKHQSFSEEKEWRLALPHTVGKPFINCEPLLRGPSSNIRYVAHNLFKNKLPIIQVKLGPLCRDAARVKEVLASYHHQVAVTESLIPLRDPTLQK